MLRLLEKCTLVISLFLTSLSIVVSVDASLDGVVDEMLPITTNSHEKLAPADRVIEDGCYFIIFGANEHRCLEIDDWRKDDNADLKIDIFFGSTNQRFYFQYCDNGCYTITEMHSKKNLRVSDNKSSRSNIVQAGNVGGADDKWELIPTEDGYYYIRNKSNGCCLDNGNDSSAIGGVVGSYPFNGTEAQKWLLIPVNENEIGNLNNGFYEIASANDENIVLDVYNDSMDLGTLLIAGSKKDASVYTVSNQRFYVEYQGDGYYSLMPLHSGMYIHASGDEAATAVYQYEGNTISNANWKIIPSDNGTYYLCNRETEGYLSFNDLGEYPNNKVTTEDFDGSASQQWKFLPIDINEFELKVGYYRIVAGFDRSRVLDIHYADENDGGDLVSYVWKDDPNQRFYVERQSDGYYTIMACHSGRYIHVSDEAGYKKNVHQWGGSDYLNARWQIIPTGDGKSYYLRNKHYGGFLDGNGEGGIFYLTFSFEVYMDAFNGSAYQKWIFEEIGGSSN